MKKIILLGCFIAFANTLSSQDNDHLIDHTYKLHKVQSITEFIASDELKGRDTPSIGLELAAEYAAEFFENAGLQFAHGLEGYFQPVNMVHKGQPDEIKIRYQGEEITTQGNLLLLSGGEEPIKSEVIIFDPQINEIEDHDVEGKFLIVYVGKNGNLNPQQIIKQSRMIERKARVAKAKGLIELFEESNPYWDRFYNYYNRSKIELDLSKKSQDDFKHLLVRDINSTVDSRLSKDPSGELKIDVIGLKEKKFVTNNVVAMVQGTDPVLKNEFIVCSAHYDHVGVGKPDASGDSIYNGARDNAIGVMSVLMAAENMAKYPPKRSVIFVLFTGEEKGLLGSKWFVQESPVALNNIVFCLNSDGGGYNDTTIVTVIGKRRINTNQVFNKACEAFGLEAFDGTDEAQFLFNNSDNIILSREGIPSVTFSAGFRDMDEEILQHYHQPSDETGTMNFNYILKFAQSFGFALREIADSDEPLFWKEEDEFFEIGIELYQ
jgi:hypothetical protein